MPDSPRPNSGKRTTARRRRRKPLIQTVPDEEKGLADVVKEEVRRDLPGTLLSLGLHVIVLLVLGLIPILLESDPKNFILELAWADPSKSRPLDPVEIVSPIQLNRPPMSTTPVPLEPKEDEPDKTSPAGVSPVPVIGSLGGRKKRDDEELTTRDGFLTEARKALDRSHNWLVRQQQDSGAWSLSGPYPHGVSRDRWSTDVGATGLALLAFLGDGHTHRTGNFTKQVSKGLDWLLSMQRPSGEIYDGQEEGEEPSIYSHAIATIVLCEAMALEGDESLRDPAQNAVNFLLSAQNPVHGGWRYRPLADTGEGDLSVTGWALMALHTARMAGLEVDSSVFLITSGFLDACQENSADPAFYKYLPSYSADPNQRVSMTSSGLLARQWLGWPQDHPALIKGADFLLDDLNRPVWDSGKRNVYAWYYQTQVLHNMGGERWKEWFMQTQETVVENQETRGKNAGSWHPTEPPGNVHEWSGVAGRLYVTVMCVLILETPIRHAPLYDESE